MRTSLSLPPIDIVTVEKWTPADWKMLGLAFVPFAKTITPHEVGDFQVYRLKSSRIDFGDLTVAGPGCLGVL